MPPKNWDKEIWGDLSQIDVTQYAMRKGTRGFNPLYIPWSVVHHILMDKYAGHYTRTDHPLEILPDGTGLVKVTVEIRGVEKTAMLAVMNHKFEAIQADARNTADAYQRACVKATGLFGLGISLWITGEGEPVTLDAKSVKVAYSDAKDSLFALIGQIEDDTTSTIDADVLALARALLEDKTKPTQRILDATEYIQSQL